jgi:predicted esterase
MPDRTERPAPDFIHRFVPAQRQDAPLLLVFHGHGGNEGALVELARFLAPAAHILSPRGQASEDGDARWWPRTPGIDEFTRADVVDYMEHALDFVEDAIARYEIAPRRVAAMGWSNGGSATLAAIVIRPDLIGDAVVFKASLPLEPDPGGGPAQAHHPDHGRIRGRVLPRRRPRAHCRGPTRHGGRRRVALGQVRPRTQLG